MANPNKRYRQRKHLRVSPAKPNFRQYITDFAEWAKGCRTSCKECGKEIANPTTAVNNNAVTADYICECGRTTHRTATESEMRRRYAEAQ